MNCSEPYIGTHWGMVVCVDDYGQDGMVAGKIYYRYRKNPVCFYELTEAILLMEQIFDDIGYPFAGTENRYFLNKGKPGRKKYTLVRKLSDEDMLKKSGDRGTFIVRVEQRQHSSWQGRVTWVEKNETVVFRSALELIKLMDEALENGNAQSKGAEDQEAI